MAETDQPAENGESTWGVLKERFQDVVGELEQKNGVAIPGVTKTKSEYFILYVGLGVLAVAAIIILLFNLPRKKSDANDLGQGVFNASGLRGHLVTRWAKGKTQYQLQIQPIDPRSNAGFALVAGDPPQPIFVNMRILDSSGFALCGKQIIMRFDPSREFPMLRKASQTGGKISRGLAKQQEDLLILQAEEQDRERGKDIFQNQQGSDGKASSMYSEGVLPCSADQYKHFDYWDFSSNFPTMDEQDRLLKHPKDLLAFNPPEKSAKKKSSPMQSAYYIEGDDRVLSFDPSSGSLETSMNRRFIVGIKSDQAVAAGWAADVAHFHYKCDQRSNCALMHAGTSAVISARLNE
ncbi:MAG TPA: hypothetical protein VKR52_20190 [Terracidiphilus sp.]|nr:hypothetical protein [Terracidiphilus sp.]